MSNLKSAMQDMEAVFGMKPGALQKAIADDIAHRAAATKRSPEPQAAPGEVERMVGVQRGSATGRGTAQRQTAPGEIERMVGVTKGSATGRSTAGSA